MFRVNYRIGSTRAIQSRATAGLIADELANLGRVTARSDFPDRYSLMTTLARGRINIATDVAAGLLASIQETEQFETNITKAVDSLRRELMPMNIIVSDHSPARDVPALVMQQTRASELGIHSLNQLVQLSDALKVGGLGGIDPRTWKSFGFGATPPFQTYIPLDSGGPLQTKALADTQIDVALTFTCDPLCIASDTVSFVPPDHKTPADNIVALIRMEDATTEVLEAINRLMQTLTTKQLASLNNELSAIP